MFGFIWKVDEELLVVDLRGLKVEWFWFMVLLYELRYCEYLINILVNWVIFCFKELNFLVIKIGFVSILNNLLVYCFKVFDDRCGVLCLWLVGLLYGWDLFFLIFKFFKKSFGKLYFFVFSFERCGKMWYILLFIWLVIFLVISFWLLLKYVFFFLSRLEILLNNI